MSCIYGIEQPCDECRMCRKKRSEKKMSNADKIRGMSNEELEESRIDRIDIYCKSDEQMWTGDFYGIAESKEEELRMELEWLESECNG